MVKKRGKLLNIKEGFIASEQAEAVGGTAPSGRLPGPSRARGLHTPGGRVAWARPSGADKPFVEAEVEAPLEEEPTDRNVADESRYQAPHVPDAPFHSLVKGLGVSLFTDDIPSLQEGSGAPVLVITIHSSARWGDQRRTPLLLCLLHTPLFRNVNRPL